MVFRRFENVREVNLAGVPTRQEKKLVTSIMVPTRHKPRSNSLLVPTFCSTKGEYEWRFKERGKWNHNCAPLFHVNIKRNCLFTSPSQILHLKYRFSSVIGRCHIKSWTCYRNQKRLIVQLFNQACKPALKLTKIIRKTFNLQTTQPRHIFR